MVPADQFERIIRLEDEEWNQLSAALSRHQTNKNDRKNIRERIKRARKKLASLIANRHIPLNCQETLKRLPPDLLHKSGLYEIVHNPNVDEEWSRLAAIWLETSLSDGGAPADHLPFTTDPGAGSITLNSQRMCNVFKSYI